MIIFLQTKKNGEKKISNNVTINEEINFSEDKNLINKKQKLIFKK